MTLKILIVEDDPLWLEFLKEKLKASGSIVAKDTMAAAIEELNKSSFDIAFFDLDLEERLGGLKLVSIAKSLGIYSVVVSALDSDDAIKQGYLVGCSDYLVKPITDDAVNFIFQKFRMQNNAQNVEQYVKKHFITYDLQTLDTLEIIKRIDLSQKSVLILGESGTGKTHLAKVIHDVGSDPKAPFVALNCSQFNDSTIDSELFGHIKGSFTGANKDKIGLIEHAQNGTLFLDEVHSLSPRAQQKLLKALDEGIIYPLGSEKPKHINFRAICASCENLEKLILENSFRRDLYNRIKTFELYLKPLRDRKADILPLIEFCIDKKLRKVVLEDDVKEILVAYNWPSNTREIEDLVENWHIRGLGIIQKNDLPEHFLMPNFNFDSSSFFTPEQVQVLESVGLKKFTEVVKDQAIYSSYKASNGRQIEAAKKLKISRSAMSKALHKLKGTTLEAKLS